MIIDRPPFLFLNIQNVPTAIAQAEPHSRVPASLPDDEAVLGASESLTPPELGTGGLPVYSL